MTATRFTWGRICVFCMGSFEAPDDAGWSRQTLPGGPQSYHRCPDCTTEGRTLPPSQPPIERTT